MSRPSLLYQAHTAPLGIAFYTGRQFPAQTSDASLGQPHIIVQIQNGVQKVVYPTPFTSGTFVLPSWMQ